MDMPSFHRRVLDAAVEVCMTHGLALAGGYALRAHGLTDRPSQDLDFATFNQAPLSDIMKVLVASYRDAGFDVKHIRGNEVLDRILVSEPATGGDCVVDVMKLPLQRPPAMIGNLPGHELAQTTP